jgi:hypothetical protein
MKIDDENREHVYDYLSMHEEDVAEKIPLITTWILRNFTVPHMQQIRAIYWKSTNYSQII